MCLNGASQRTNSISDFYHFFSGVITLLALAGSGGIHVLWNFSSIFKKSLQALLVLVLSKSKDVMLYLQN